MLDIPKDPTEEKYLQELDINKDEADADYEQSESEEESKERESESCE